MQQKSPDSKRKNSNLIEKDLFDYQCTDEWNNFLERVKSTEEDIKGSEFDELVEELRLWASYRGQTLTRTGYFSFTPPPPPPK